MISRLLVTMTAARNGTTFVCFAVIHDCIMATVFCAARIPNNNGAAAFVLREYLIVTERKSCVEWISICNGAAYL